LRLLGRELQQLKRGGSGNDVDIGIDTVNDSELVLERQRRLRRHNRRGYHAG